MLKPGWYPIEFVNDFGDVTHRGVAYVESDCEAIFFEDGGSDAPLFAPGRFDPSRPEKPFSTGKGLRLLRLGVRVNLPLIVPKAPASV